MKQSTINAEEIFIYDLKALQRWKQAIANAEAKTMIKNTSIHFEQYNETAFKMIIEETKAYFLIQLGIEICLLMNRFQIAKCNRIK